MANIEMYEGFPITFENKDGKMMVNATQMAKAFGKKPTYWLRTEQANRIINAVSGLQKCEPTDLVMVINGDGGGTWMHEDVALPFAQWLSPEFYIWCNDHIKEKGTKMISTNQSLFETKAVSKATDQLMSVQTEQTITSLEVAELTGKQHTHIMRDIRNIVSQLGEGAQSNFGLSEYKDSTGRTLPCYRLTKEGCLCLVSGYDANLRMKIINRWKELEQQQVPRTFSSALKLAYEQALLIEAQNAQIATLTPKADYCDKVLTSQSTFTTTQVAKGYGISSAMKLNKMLKDHHIMFKQSNQWMPTSEYATKPYWEETTATISLGDDKVHTKKYYKWTELGIKWLREKFGFERYFDYNLAHNEE